MKRIDDIFERLNVTYVSPQETNYNSVLKEIPNGIKEVVMLNGDVSQGTANSNENANKTVSELSNFLEPPNEKYTTIIPEEAIPTVNNISNLANKQLIQQFYEIYLVPIGKTEVYNRLGSIAANIKDLHSLYPTGIKGLISKDDNASWRTNLNFSFKFDTGLRYNNGTTPVYETYNSLSFPPFKSHEDTYDLNSFFETKWKQILTTTNLTRKKTGALLAKKIHTIIKDGEGNTYSNTTLYYDANNLSISEKEYNELKTPSIEVDQSFEDFETTETSEETSSIINDQTKRPDSSFDLQNILYRRDKATYRFPAFKTVNDNIHLLQTFMEKCFGIISTYMNEWDLSLYMQEGINILDEAKTVDNKTIKQVKYVSNLTYGLLDDVPAKHTGKYTKDVNDNSIEELDMDEALPYAAVNLAVSTRWGVDDYATGTQSNLLNYEITKYPYSNYYLPWNDGSYFDETGMSRYITEIFSYRENGQVYMANLDKPYTPEIYHGRDLSHSSKNFLQVLNYVDDRYAILSGWNAVDEEGNLLLTDWTTNGNEGQSNAFSYLPFWKLFYTDENDGMSDIDKIYQQIVANGKPYSWLTCAWSIIGNKFSNVEKFGNLISDAYAAKIPKDFIKAEDDGNDIGDAIDISTPNANDNTGGSAQLANAFSGGGGGGGGYSDYKFKLFKCSLTIPGSKLLKMFLNKNKSKSSAMASANSAQSALTSSASSLTGGITDDSGNISNSDSISSGIINGVKASVKTGSPKTIIENGQAKQVDTYIPTNDDDLANKKAPEDGIATYSPFIYGGPHGMYYSPNTLEGYAQTGNRNLSNVPTIDGQSLYENFYNTNADLRNFSKNFKKFGSFMDAVTAVTPNERYALLSGGYFGVKDIRNYNVSSGRWLPVTYTSNPLPRTTWGWYSCHCRWHWRLRHFFWWEHWTDLDRVTYKWEIRWRTITIRVPRLYIRRFRVRLGWKSIKIGIPYWAYVKTYATGNNWIGKWGRWRHWTNTSYSYRRTHVQYEYFPFNYKDFPNQDFRLLPVIDWGETRFNPNRQYTAGGMRQHIFHDQCIFARRTDYTVDSSNNFKWSWRSDLHVPDATCVRYMIVPSNIQAGVICGAPGQDNTRYGKCGVAVNYRTYDQYYHYATYTGAGTEWYKTLKDMWNEGRREVVITLPIKAPEYATCGSKVGGEILTLISGIARIQHDKTIRIERVLRTGKYLHCYRHGRGPQKRRATTYSSCGQTYTTYSYYGCPHPHYVTYYYWSWEPVYADTYNLFFYPRYTKWNLPTSTLLNKEYVRPITLGNTPDIVERYRVDERKDYEDNNKYKGAIGINNRGCILYPFTTDFMDKYGKYEPGTVIPGKGYNHWDLHTMGGLRVLHSQGVYWKDIIEDFRSNGEVRITNSIRTQWNSIDLYNGGSSKNSYVSRYSRPWVYTTYYSSNNVDWIKAYANMPHQYPVPIRDSKLTDLLKNCQYWPSVMQYETKDLKDTRMFWYKPTTAMQVYIDTATQQISWLKQLQDYARYYLKDYLIWQVYQKSVDNLTKKTISNYVNGKNTYKNEVSTGFTDSWSEDINYHDALVIANQAFYTTDENRNTLFDLVTSRIQKLEILKNKAEEFKKVFLEQNTNGNSIEAFYDFVKLVTNTGSYLQCAKNGNITAESVIFNSEGQYTGKIFNVNSNTTYDLIHNPATVLWAYINVLYQVRRYWINMRFNKRSGSYWQLRGLERLLTFLETDAQNTVNPLGPVDSSPVAQGKTINLKAKNIKYVQPEDSTSKRVLKSINGETLDQRTLAVYVKVNYVNNPDPKNDSKWNAAKQLYDEQHIVYVPEAYKWAYQPEEGIYYVMSSELLEQLSSNTNNMKQQLTEINNKSYTPTRNDIISVIDIMVGLGYNKEDIIYVVGDPKDEKTKIRTLSEDEEFIYTVIDKDRTSLRNLLYVFITKLGEYRKEVDLANIRNNLYAVYIKWEPAHVWTGFTKDDIEEHIDEWQKNNTAGKERKVEDLWGIEHTSNEAISSGITFDVVESLNADTLLSNTEALKSATPLEILCSTQDKIDLWRIEIPAGMNIPPTQLKNKPILVPEVQINAALNGLKNKPGNATELTTLAGAVSTVVSPILEADSSMLTINSLSALGEYDNILSNFDLNDKLS